MESEELLMNGFVLYLSNRFQTVKINGKLSNKELITCGVPQGSILGSVLFLIYINDIKNSSNILNFFLFADDTSTYLTGNNAKKIEATYNSELKKVLCWLNANKLSLNTDKSNLVLFRGPRKKIQYKINVQINGKQIKEKEFTKYLGILIDNKVSWPAHKKYADIKISKGIGVLTKLRYYVSKETLRMLYFSFVQPHLDYGLLVWGGSNKCVSNPIRKNLKKTIRRMLFKKFNDSTELLFKELNILDFDSQHNLIIGKFMWQVNNKEIPRNISKLFHVKGNNIKYHIPSGYLNVIKNSVLFQGPKFWNEIPIDIRNKKSLISFKTSYCKYLSPQ